MPWMLSRSTLRWRLAPPLPSPLPPLPRPDMLLKCRSSQAMVLLSGPSNFQTLLSTPRDSFSGRASAPRPVGAPVLFWTLNLRIFYELGLLKNTAHSVGKNVARRHCTAHSGAKKAHDWSVDQLADLFRTTQKVKTQQVVKNRGQHCGDVELVGYLANTTDPVPLVLDLRIAHDRFGSSSDHSLNGHLHYPNDIDRSINETVVDKIRKYRPDYNNNPPNVVSFMPVMASTSGRLHSEFIRLLFLQAHRETDRFFAVSGVQVAQHDSGQFHFRRATYFVNLKSKRGNLLAKSAVLRITLNLDGAPITSKSRTQTSHSQTSRLLTSSLSFGVPVPRPTQCMRDA
jgi:hypothetical protein